LDRREMLYDGSSKRLFSTDRDHLVLLEFKDDVLDQNGSRRVKIAGRGEINAAIAGYIFQYLENYHVPTHLVEQNSHAQLLVKKLNMIPIQVEVYNLASAKLAQRFRLEEGQRLEFPIIEYYLKAARLGNPQINESHALALGYAKMEEIRAMGRMASKANAILKSLFERRGLALMGFSLEFGCLNDRIYIGDEISADTCRLWDKKKNRKMDKERYMQDTGTAERCYRELLDRLTKAM
jgi:phosphoribosylaminoimidazole-succinocarboxamide synthase